MCHSFSKWLAKIVSYNENKSINTANRIPQGTNGFLQRSAQGEEESSDSSLVSISVESLNSEINFQDLDVLLEKFAEVGKQFKTVGDEIVASVDEEVSINEEDRRTCTEKETKT